MSESTGTVTQRLADLLLQRPLAEYVAEKRSSTPRWSWRLIAEQLAKDTNNQVTVSHTALISWFADPGDQADDGGEAA